MLCLIAATSCQKPKHPMTTILPPIADKKPRNLEIHNDLRVDNYYWLNDREDPDVLAYLKKENDYYQAMTAHTTELQAKLFDEMKGRIKEDDSSLPYKFNGYWYATRFETGKEYPIYTRKKGTLEAREQIMFNCNLMAIDQEYFNLKGISVSPDNTLAAFGIDTVSRRQYYIQIKNLETGELYPDKVDNTTGSVAWANDNKTFYYTKKDPVTLRSDKIYKHVLGTPEAEDVLVYHEKDATFNTSVFKTKSRKYIVIGSLSTLTSEYQILNADNPDGSFRIFSPRKQGLEYSIYHYNSVFYVLTNKDGATNFKLMKVGEEDTPAEFWEEFISHRDDVLLEDVEIFKEYYVLFERDNGLNKVKVNRWDKKDSYYLPFDNETYTVFPYVNLDFDTETLRYIYNSMTAPYAIIDLNMRTKVQVVKKEQEVLDKLFKKENYQSKRIWATARDGVKVPISLAFHKDTPLESTTPLLLYGYGAYGATMDPYFSTGRLSLLDRGFVYAIAHVRGSEYLGRPWYEAGKLLNKKNTFTDFIDCSKYLIEKKYTGPKHLYVQGGSAGGLLIGAVVNMAPELYHGAVAEVPFVDVITTMLDETIPLTTGEYDEWGNPNDSTYYHYMKSYSPYDNIVSQVYPHMYISTGLHDSQVQYWEPAKWVAKLRTYKTDDNLLFLDTNMDAGHGGASGRYEALKETAKVYAFILDLEGKDQ